MYGVGTRTIVLLESKICKKNIGGMSKHISLTKVASCWKTKLTGNMTKLQLTKEEKSVFDFYVL